MAPRYHRPQKHVECPCCHRRMEMGQRVGFQLSWEQGRRDIRDSRATIICPTCAAEFSRMVGLDVPKGDSK